MPSANANLTPSPCCASIGRIRRYIQTCDAWTLPLFAATASARSTSSAAASPASPSASLASAAAPQTSATCGQSSPGSSVNADLLGLSLRMFLASEALRQTECSLTWKRSATPAGRSWWVLRMPAHPTNALAHGLWLGTATASMRKRIARFRDGRSPNPVEAAYVPTLTVHGNNNRIGCTETSGNGLATVLRSWLPTLHAGAHKGPPGKGCRGRGGRQADLNVAVGGPLNPKWLEWFMGFPEGATELGASETPRSRRSSR